MRKCVKMQGKAAEGRVSALLHGLGVNYHVFDNVMLKTAMGKGTTQIDHVVVSSFGIFVVETKSHKGWIYGDCVHKNWTQVLYSRNGSLRYKFYSPYLQNAGHLKNMYKLTGLDCSYFMGLVVFTNPGADLCNVACPCVIRADDLQRVVWSQTQVKLPQDAVNRVCALLTEANVQSKYFDRKHVSYVRRLQDGYRC